MDALSIMYRDYRSKLFFWLISTVFYRSSNTLHDLRGIPLQKQDTNLYNFIRPKTLCQQIKKKSEKGKSYTTSPFMFMNYKGDKILSETPGGTQIPVYLRLQHTPL